MIECLKDYVSQPDRDLDAELAAAVRERERFVAAARERLLATRRRPSNGSSSCSGPPSSATS